MHFARIEDSAIFGSAKTRKWFLVRILVLACAVVAGCSRDRASAGAPAEATADPAAEEESATQAEPDTSDAWRPDEERESLPSNRIYYTLTDYPWYAHGQPLLHEGRPHVATGLPIAASVEEMAKAGEYDGVEFYTRREETEPVLYVPVFEGYWLAFRLDTTGGGVVKSAAQ